VWGHGRHHGARRVVAPRGVGEAPRGGDGIAALARVPQGQLELGQPSRTSFRSFSKMKENKKKNTAEYGEIAFFELDRTTKNVVL
jgi:hypothetical protein